MKKKCSSWKEIVYVKNMFSWLWTSVWTNDSWPVSWRRCRTHPYSKLMTRWFLANLPNSPKLSRLQDKNQYMLISIFYPTFIIFCWSSFLIIYFFKIVDTDHTQMQLSSSNIWLIWFEVILRVIALFLSYFANHQFISNRFFFVDF